MDGLATSPHSQGRRKRGASRRSKCGSCGRAITGETQFCTHCGTPASTGSGKIDPFVGRTISGRYRIVRKLARGGMGEVYIARHLELNQHVAVKLLHRRFADDEELAARFTNEAHYYCKVNHPYAVTVYDFGRLDDGTLYIVMEFIDGLSVAQKVRRDGQLSPEAAIRVIGQTAEVLATAHQQGIIHRDIKPDNIMLVEGPGQRYTVKILDFGIAKLLDDENTKLTETGIMYGTPEYMSPEQASGGELDARTDIYSLGLVLYYMLVGNAPFEGRNKMALLQRQVKEAPPLVADILGGELPPGLSDFVDRLLAKDPQVRPSTMEQVLIGLDRVATAGALRLSQGIIFSPDELAMPPDPANATSRVTGRKHVSRSKKHDKKRGLQSPDIQVLRRTGPSRFSDDGSAPDDDDPSFELGDIEPLADGFEHGRSGDLSVPVDLESYATSRHGGGARSSLISWAIGLSLLMVASIATLFYWLDRPSVSAPPEEPVPAESAAPTTPAERAAHALASGTHGAALDVASRAARDDSADEPGDGRPGAEAVAEAQVAAAAVDRPDDGLRDEIRGARRALDEGDLASARAAIEAIEGRHGELTDGAGGALADDVERATALEQRIEGALSEGRCHVADEAVIELRETISRPLAYAYYGRLDRCRAAANGGREARTAPSPERAAPRNRPSEQSSGGGMVLPPDEL